MSIFGGGNTRPHVIPCPAAVVVRVRCSRTLHRIAWDGGIPRFDGHTLPDLRFELAMGTADPCHCAEILRSLRSSPEHGSYGALPPPLRRAAEGYRAHRASLGHGTPPDPARIQREFRKTLREDAIARHFAPLVQTLQAAGLRLWVKPPMGINTPEAIAILLTSAGIAGTTQVGFLRADGWHLDIPHLLALACDPALQSHLCTDHTGCRPCGFRSTERRSLAAHLQTAPHGEGVLRKVHQVFGSIRPTRFAAGLPRSTHAAP